jgi:hypothetical protein
MDEFMTDAWANFVVLALSNGANAFQSCVTAEHLDQFASEFDLIIAVYPEMGAPAGLQFLPIKGWDVFVRGERDIRSNAIPCVNKDAALRLLSRFGDLRWAKECLMPAPERRLS